MGTINIRHSVCGCRIVSELGRQLGLWILPAWQSFFTGFMYVGHRAVMDMQVARAEPTSSVEGAH